MKKSVIVILAVIMVSPYIARSQNEGVKGSTIQGVDNTVSTQEKTTAQMGVISEYEKSGGAQGNYMVYDQSGMYLEPGWSPGYVVLKDKTTMNDLMLRYDLYHQQLQFVKEGDTMAFANPSELEYVFIGDRKFIYTEYKSDNAILKGYLEVLHEGSCPLYAHRGIKYHLNPEDRPTLTKDVYIRECCYYVKKEGQIPQAVRPNRKSILNVFQDKQSDVARFMDDNGLTGKTCDELKLVIAFYNSLP
jgi:hypothetical protein